LKVTKKRKISAKISSKWHVLTSSTCVWCKIPVLPITRKSKILPDCNICGIK
jgi:hypothetical protein